MGRRQTYKVLTNVMIAKLVVSAQYPESIQLQVSRKFGVDAGFSNIN